MKINSNTYSVDISTNVIVDERNIGYSDFDVRMSLNEILKKIRNLEFTFGKASLNKGFLKFEGARKNQTAQLFMNKNDLIYIYETYRNMK
tara:strand:+ start:185 stop:454 length:270 start_codon:yes stop_codon:yes gene_type:complete